MMTINRKRSKKIWWLLPVAAAIFLLWIFLVNRDHIPSWVRWNRKTESAELADGSAVSLKLSSRKFTVSRDDRKVYQSDPKVMVSDFIVGDIDHDGVRELLLLVWKKGSFGKYKPFWLEKDEEEYSEHLFIYDLDPEREDLLDPIWMSSKMGFPAAKLWMDEQDDLWLEDKAGSRTCWRWESWGLVLMSSEK